MDKKAAKQLQKALCLELKDFYEERGFKLNKKEWGFDKKNIVIPFFLMATRGPYITIRPCIINKSSVILDGINSIVRKPILNNGSFIAGRPLDSSLKSTEVDLPYQEKVKEIAQLYYLRIFDNEDIEWVVKWHKAYMEKVGWQLIDRLIEEKDTYELYKNFFNRYLENQDTSRGSKIRLDFGSHATMIYLGYKNKEKEADDLVEKTIKNFENSLFHQRAIEIQEHFTNQV